MFSIIIPVYNEDESVIQLADEVNTAMQNVQHEWECLWINDGSTDSTLRLLQYFSAANLHHRVINLVKNYGQSGAIFCGILQAKGEVIGTLDGDGQNDPAELPRLLEWLEKEDVDLVNGIRTPRQDSFIRRLSSKTANRFRQIFTGDCISDIGCSLRVFRKKFCAEIPCFKALHRFLPIMLSMRGARMCEIPVNHRPRQRGKSKYGVGNRLWVGLADTFAVCWMRRRLIWPQTKDDA